MEIRELRYFLHLAETLNFNRTAERLNISQPVVTRVIAQLEHSLGTKLFDRNTRRVSLTPAGVVLLREAKPLLSHIESVQRTVRHAIAERSGRFSVGATTTAMQTVMPTLLRQFQKSHPDIELEVREMPTQAQVEALLSAELDLGFVLLPAEDPALTIRPVHRERMRLAVPDYHPHAAGAQQGRAIPLSAFANDYFIMPPRHQNPAMYDEIIRACEGAGFRPRLRECGENETCVSHARAGLGVVFVMGQAPDFPREGLAILDIEDPVPILEIAMAWRTDDPSSCLVEFQNLDPSRRVPA